MTNENAGNEWVKLDCRNGVEANGKKISPAMCGKLRDALFRANFREGKPHNIRIKVSHNAAPSEYTAIPLTKDTDFREVPRAERFPAFFIAPEAVGRIADEVDTLQARITAGIQAVKDTERKTSVDNSQWGYTGVIGRKRDNNERDR